MSAGKLNKTLIVRNPDTYVAVALVKGSELPDWATDLVHPDDLDESNSDGSDSEVEPSGDRPPPMAGKGSGTAAWVKYAESVEVDLSGLGDDPKRDDVVDAIRTAGHPVEPSGD